MQGADASNLSQIDGDALFFPSIAVLNIIAALLLLFDIIVVNVLAVIVSDSCWIMSSLNSNPKLITH